ncbi:MAG: Fe-S cluster assembly protein SufD [Gammaproteobacteria bacterium]|nr:Fe-S cluster assembly protein SufD [Gammaproteobacteria bacterium]
MSIAADQTQSWLDQHPGAPLAGAGASWLDSARANALALFERIGLPGVRDEQWRYTNLRALKSKLYQPAANSQSDWSLPESDHPRFVLVDGVYNAGLSNLEGVAKGVQFMPLDDAVADSRFDLETRFGSTLPAQQHGFSALNTAYCQGGYVLMLGAGATSKSPLEVLFLNSATDSTADASAISHTRNFIIADANSQCTVIERHQGTDGSVYLHNTITEIIAGDNAHIDHYKIQQDSCDAFHIGGVFIEQARSAQVKTHNLALGGLVARNDVRASLSGEGAHIEMNGLVFGRGRQHVDNHTEVVHAVPHCTSDEYYRSVLDDQSRSVFRGRIIVAQDAQQTNAEQQNNNLLLSAGAEADTKPQLEIYADDVQCSHGATVGQLDPKSLFYLNSRGIDTESARALLTFAFANEVIERIAIESVRDEMTQLIAGALLDGMEELL